MDIACVVATVIHQAPRTCDHLLTLTRSGSHHITKGRIQARITVVGLIRNIARNPYTRIVVAVTVLIDRQIRWHRERRIDRIAHQDRLDMLSNFNNKSFLI